MYIVHGLGITRRIFVISCVLYIHLLIHDTLEYTITQLLTIHLNTQRFYLRMDTLPRLKDQNAYVHQLF